MAPFAMSRVQILLDFACLLGICLASLDVKEGNIYFYSRHYAGSYGTVYQMSPALGHVVDEGFELVDGGNARPGDVSYLRGYHSVPEDEGYLGNDPGYVMLRVCSMEQTSQDGNVMTFHTLFLHDCQDILDVLDSIPQGTTRSVTELTHIFVPTEETLYQTRVLRAVICQGHNDLLYGFVTRSFAYCPAGHFKLHEFQFHALGGGIYCPDIEPEDSMEVFYEIEHDALKKTALITCNPPYRLNTTLWPPFQGSLECSDNGRWLGEALGCEYINCGDPPTVPHGKFNGSSYGYKSMVNLVCDEGYEIEIIIESPTVKDTSSIHCTNSSMWSKQLSRCAAKNCGPPPKVDHGTFSGNSFEFPNTVELLCDLGYIKTSDTVQQCGADGNWSDSISKCEPINCGEPDAPVHGFVIGKLFGYGEMVAFGCDEGYSFSKRVPYIHCQDNGRWEDNDGACERIICPTLEAPSNGEMKYAHFEYQAIVEFSCDVGYNMIGNETLHCLNVDGIGAWSSQAPVCRIMDCGQPTNMIDENGSMAHNDTILHSTIDLECNPGYELSASSMCTPDGWSAIDLSCKEKTMCHASEMYIPAFATINITGSGVDLNSSELVSPGTVINYTCIENYQYSSRINQGISVCLLNSSWMAVPHITKCSPMNVDGNVKITPDEEGLYFKGTVAFYYSGNWYTMITFDGNVAMVVCRQLGLAGGEIAGSNYEGYRRYISSINCDGTENRITDCSYHKSSSHTNSNTYRIRCNPVIKN